MPNQYKCSSEMGIPQRYHLQCCFTDLWQKQAKTADWFEAHLDKTQPFIDEKRRALASYKSSPSERTLQMLRAALNVTLPLIASSERNNSADCVT